MRTALKKLIFTALLAGLAGCAPEKPAAPVPDLPGRQAGAAPVAAPAAAPAQGDARLAGAVRFEGPVPPPVRSAVKSFSECAVHHKGDVFSEDVLVKDGRLQNVFIYVKEGLGAAAFPPPKEAAVLDQLGCIYKPHVLGVQTGQELVIKNSDVSLHNVHSHSVNQKPFNVGMPVQGMKIKKTFSVPEVAIPLTCDVHPWMKSYIGVVAHPFYAVTGEDGAFELKGLAAGTYTVEAWHEKFGTRTETVTLTGGESKELTFTFSAN
jgi:plastocyanin